MARVMDKKYGIKTTELYMVPQTREELRELIEAETDPEHKAELEAILQRVEQNLEDAIWYTYWKVTRRKERDLHVGGFWFMGAPDRGDVEVRFTIFKDFRGRRYASQCLYQLVDWAYANKVYSIRAAVDAQNSSAISVLDRSGFSYRGGDRYTHYYSAEKQRTGWAGLYLFIGVFAGFMLGIVFESMVIGMIAGVMLGIVVGAGMDINESKEREKITGKKYIHRKFGRRL